MATPDTETKNVSAADLDAIVARVSASLGDQVAKALKDAMPKKDAVDPPFERVKAASITRDRKFTLKEGQKGIAAARMLRALAHAKGNQGVAVDFIKNVYDDDLGDEIKKAMTAGNFTAGGGLIPPEYAAEIIELLRSAVVVRRAGPRTVPMNSGSLTIRRQTAGSNVGYVGESRNISSTQPAIGDLVMTSKKLAAIVPISNDLLTFASGPSADEFVRDDLVEQIAVREDRAFLRDDGTQFTPKGMRHWADPDNVTASNGTSETNIEQDFKDLQNALEGKDVKLLRPAWFMHPTRKNHLATLRTTNGNLVFPSVQANGTLLTWPLFSTTSVPANLGAGGDESEIMFADMADAIIGDATGLQIDVDPSASYIENGVLVSAFTRDETVMRAIERHDFAMRHDESVAVKTGVTWGG